MIRKRTENVSFLEAFCAFRCPKDGDMAFLAVEKSVAKVQRQKCKDIESREFGLTAAVIPKAYISYKLGGPLAQASY